LVCKATALFVARGESWLCRTYRVRRRRAGEPKVWSVERSGGAQKCAQLYCRKDVSRRDVSRRDAESSQRLL